MMWLCACSTTSAALAPFERFGAPQRAALLGGALRASPLRTWSLVPLIKDTLEDKDASEEEKEVARKLRSQLLKEMVNLQDSEAAPSPDSAPSDGLPESFNDGHQGAFGRLRETLQKGPFSRDRRTPETDRIRMHLVEHRSDIPFWRFMAANLLLNVGASLEALHSLLLWVESPTRASQINLDLEANHELEAACVKMQASPDRLQDFGDTWGPLVSFERASALEGVGCLEQLSSAERYHEVKRAWEAYERLDQEFRRLINEKDELTEGEQQAARLLWMRLGEAYEHSRDMNEKLHELEGNEEKLRNLKEARARDIKMYGRLDSRARLERAFLKES